jgi:MFS superfamily sulfate permease-like transporter
VDYLPLSVVSGFLGCVGYKVAYYSIKLSVGYHWYHPESWEFWKLLIPVPFIGLPLYYMKVSVIPSYYPPVYTLL